MTRLRTFMEERGWWDGDQEQNLRDAERVAVMDALTTAEKRPKSSYVELFQDVYKEMPPNLIKQRKELVEHMKKYPDEYRS